MGPLVFLFDWSGRTGRGTFAAAALAFHASLAWLAWSWLSGAFDGATPRAHWPLLAVGLTLLPYTAAFVRRAHDADLPVRFLIASFVPVLGLSVVAVYGVRPSVRAYSAVASAGRQAGVLGMSLCALLISASAFLALHQVRSADMKPTLLPGDVLIVQRASRDGLVPGEIAVFRHPATGEVLARRIVAGPGALVAMEGGRPVIDGTPVAQTPSGTLEEIYAPEGPARVLPHCANAPVGEGGICVKTRLTETLPGGHTHRVLDTRNGPLDETVAQAVPAGHLFVMGDNRDNATDSRVSAQARGVGPVPMDAVIGVTGRVLFSPAGRSMLQVWRWRPGRIVARVE